MKDVRKSPTGLILSAPAEKYKVVGIDRFSDEDWEEGVYSDKNKAIKKARSLTKKASKDSDNDSIATVYYVYDDKGNYLGGGIT